MKINPPEYNRAAEQNVTESRYYVKITFDSDDSSKDLYLTSHTDVLVPTGITGTVIRNCIHTITGQSQKIIPDKNQYTIGNISLNILDVGNLFSSFIKARQDEGISIIRKRIQLYRGFKELTDPDHYALQLTYIIDKRLVYQNGFYRISTADIQRETKKDLFSNLDQGTLSRSISQSELVIPIVTANARDKFQTVVHDNNYSVDPGGVFGSPRRRGYIKIEDEIIGFNGWDPTFTQLIVTGRGLFGTAAVPHTVGGSSNDSIMVEEFVYLEMAAPRLLYALLTGVILNHDLTGDTRMLRRRANDTLPNRWHLGIPEDLVDYDEFVNIAVSGNNRWNLPAQDQQLAENSGRIIRLVGTERQTGKRFIEDQILAFLGCYMPVKADGKLGLRILSNIIPNTPHVLAINDNDVITANNLVHDFETIINNISVRWNYLQVIEDFTQETRLSDASSISAYEERPLNEIEFIGASSTAQAPQDIADYLQNIRNRYANPPITLRITVPMKFDRLEVGDIIRLNLRNLKDFNLIDPTNSFGSLNRAFEIQAVRTDWIRNRISLDLFGSTGEAEIINVQTSSGFVLNEEYYTDPPLIDLATFRALNSATNQMENVVDSRGNVRFSFRFPISHERLVVPAYRYIGNLTIPNGITVTTLNSTRLHIMGFFTNNGTINCIVSSLIAASSFTNQAGLTSQAGIGTTNSGESARVTARNVDNTRYDISGDGSDNLVSGSRSSVESFNPAVIIRELPFATASQSIIGTHSLLMGVSGRPGVSATLIQGQNFGTPRDPDRRFSIQGSPGAQRTAPGGGGLLIICRGAAFGSDSLINCDGQNNANASGIVFGNGNRLFGQSSASGYPGSIAVLLDGSLSSAPVITANNFRARRGVQTVPQGLTREIGASSFLNDERVYGERIIYVDGGGSEFGRPNLWNQNHVIRFIRGE